MTIENYPSDDLSQIYHSLRVPRRRILIQLIAGTDEDSLTVRSCARHIAAVENEVQLQAATGEKYRNVYNSLSQTHLSTLADADVVIYDPDRQTVAAGPNLQLGMLIISLNRVTYQVLQGQCLTDFDNSD